MLRVVLRVVRFEGHAVVAHGVCPVFAEARVASTWDLSILRAPIPINCVFFDEVPWAR